MVPPKVVLITGANSGVGMATTKVLVSASNDYHVIISARSLSKAQIAKSEVEAENPSSASRLSIVQLDVTDGDSISQARDFVEENFGHLDALINNASSGNGDLDVYTRYKACMDTNVIGAAVVAEVFRPLLLKSSKPYSIFVSNGAGSFGRAIERFNGMRDKPPAPKNGGTNHVSKAALNLIALREQQAYVDKGLKVFAMSRVS
jgi:NAD(P)-dependent dehydrogenase (short-subunit alcohol dehydrogenase family)